MAKESNPSRESAPVEEVRGWLKIVNLIATSVASLIRLFKGN